MASNEVLIVVKSKDQANFKRTRGEVKGLHADVLRASVGFKAFGGFFRSAVTGIAAGGVAAFAAVGAEVFRATKGWADHEAIVRDTAATLKATGNAAKTTVGEVSDLADAIERKTTKDGDAVQSGLNMLLTFKDIRNEVGKGNDIFNQAGMVLTDMTAKMHQGSVTNETMSQSAIQLGKALNDPVAGISALSRVGVTFTDQQKEQIKTLVKNGDTMKAQKIILAELKSEFDGAAKASAKPWDGVVVVLRQVEDAIGKFLLPKVQAVSNWVLNTGLPALDRLRKEWKRNKDSIDTLAGVILSQFIPAGDSAQGTLDGLRDKVENVELTFDRLVEGTLRVVKFWLELEVMAMKVQIAFIDIGIGAALTTSAIAHMTHHGQKDADDMVAAMRGMKAGAVKQLEDIRGKVTKTQGAIDNMHGRVLELEARDRASRVIDGVLQSIRRLPSGVTIGLGAISRGGHPAAFAGGGRPPVGLASIVGEKGPELFVPDRAGTIIPNGGGMGGGAMVLEIRSGGSRLDDLLVEILSKAIRTSPAFAKVVRTA